MRPLFDNSSHFTSFFVKYAIFLCFALIFYNYDEYLIFKKIHMDIGNHMKKWKHNDVLYEFKNISHIQSKSGRIIISHIESIQNFNY